MTVSSRIIQLAESREPTCGPHRLICIDGPSGSGKTTLARELCARLTVWHHSVTLVSLDDIYPGWDGLRVVSTLIEPALRALAAGEHAAYVQHDWDNDRDGPTRTIEPAEFIVLEGVGSGATAWADLTTVLVWASHDDALERAIARDGEQYRSRLEQWRRDEVAVLGRERPWGRADLILR